MTEAATAIKASELRIGNLIEMSLVPISELDEYSWSACKVSYQIFKDLEGIAWEFRPIPLTPEMLVSCGFEKSKLVFTGDIGYRKSDEDGKYYIGLLENAYGFSFHNPHFNLQIKYLHQLQNLYFSLTGTELEINL
jgi:hypothetical protein